MSKTLYRRKFKPFRIFSIIRFHWHRLSNLIRPAPNNHHSRTNKQGRMLIPRRRLFALSLIRRLNPIPTAISMSPESPCIIQCALIRGPPSKDHHHPHCGAGLTQRRRMIDAYCRHIATDFQLCPAERSSFDIQTPYVIHGLAAGIPAEH